MRSSTKSGFSRAAAVLWAAAFAFLFAAGCESMKDPDGQALPWGPSNDWDYNRLPSSLMRAN